MSSHDALVSHDAPVSHDTPVSHDAPVSHDEQTTSSQVSVTHEWMTKTYRSKDFTYQRQYVPLTPSSLYDVEDSDRVCIAIEEHWMATKELQRLLHSRAVEKATNDVLLIRDEASTRGKASAGNTPTADDDAQQRWKQEISSLAAKAWEDWIRQLEALQEAVVDAEELP
ncbi:MAG: hypothetical protein Q9208_001404 [Pyrenodesmia sp. 3 TL-2023]